MILHHTFRSGNQCDVDLRNCVLEGSAGIRVEWERFPPSAQDAREWTQEVYPKVDSEPSASPPLAFGG